MTTWLLAIMALAVWGLFLQSKRIEKSDKIILDNQIAKRIESLDFRLSQLRAEHVGEWRRLDGFSKAIENLGGSDALIVGLKNESYELKDKIDKLEKELDWLKLKFSAPKPPQIKKIHHTHDPIVVYDGGKKPEIDFKEINDKMNEINS